MWGSSDCNRCNVPLVGSQSANYGNQQCNTGTATLKTSIKILMMMIKIYNYDNDNARLIMISVANGDNNIKNIGKSNYQKK